FSGTVLKHKCESAGCANAENGRWRKAEGEAIRHFGKLTVQVLHDFLILRLLTASLAPVIQSHEEEARIGRGNLVQQAEPEDAGSVFDPWSMREQPLDLFRRCPGAFDRRSRRKLEMHEEVALILHRQKA